MLAHQAIRRGQREAERLMKDKAVITRTGEWIRDEKGFETPTTITVWEGKCKIQTYEPYEQVGESAGTTVVSQRYQVQIPVSARGVQVGDVIEVKGYPHDFRVAGLHNKTFQTAQRLLCDVMSSASDSEGDQ